jgi:hypothetical protein
LSAAILADLPADDMTRKRRRSSAAAGDRMDGAEDECGVQHQTQHPLLALSSAQVPLHRMEVAQ